MRIQIIKHFIGIKECGVNLWQILNVKEVCIHTYSKNKILSQCKFYHCWMPDNKHLILLDYTEVAELK